MSTDLSATYELLGHVRQSVHAVSRDGVRFALKCQSPNSDFDLREEIDAITTLQDTGDPLLRHIIRIKDVGVWQESGPAFIMEWIELGLEDRLHLVTPRQALSLLVILAKVVAFCHQKQFLHRDLKPANVRLKQSESSAEGACEIGDQWYIPILSDFGQAKIVSEERDRAASGRQTATDRYRAPEQFAPDYESSERSDVFSLGVILYEALAHKYPHGEPSDSFRVKTVIPERIRLSPPMDQQTADWVNQICRKCLRKRPALRYETAGQLASDLTRLLREPLLQPAAPPITDETDLEDYGAYTQPLFVEFERAKNREKALEKRNKKSQRWIGWLSYALAVAFGAFVLIALIGYFGVERESLKRKHADERALNEYQQNLKNVLSDLKRNPHSDETQRRLGQLAKQRPEDSVPRLALILTAIVRSTKADDYQVARDEAQRLVDAEAGRGSIIDVCDDLVSIHKRLNKLTSNAGFVDEDYDAFRRDLKHLDDSLADAPHLREDLKKVSTFVQMHSTAQRIVEVHPPPDLPLNGPLSRLPQVPRHHHLGAQHLTADNTDASGEILFLLAAKRQFVAQHLIVASGLKQPDFADTKAANALIDEQLRGASDAFHQARLSTPLVRGSMLPLKALAGEVFCDVMRLRILPAVSKGEVIDLKRKSRFFERDEGKIDAQLLTRFTMIAMLTGALYEPQYESWRQSKIDYAPRHKAIARIVDGLLEDWEDDEQTVWAKVPNHVWDPLTKTVLEALLTNLERTPKDYVKAEGPVASSPLLRQVALAQFRRWNDRERERLMPKK